MRKGHLFSILLLFSACHGRSASQESTSRAIERYQVIVRRVVAWEELEVKLFAQEPSSRTDADIEAYLRGPGEPAKPMAPSDKAQLMQAFRNSQREVKPPDDQRDFDACQVSVQNEMTAWFDQVSPGTPANLKCEVAKAAAAAEALCPKTAKVAHGQQEQRNCACERALLWKTIVDEAGVGDLVGKVDAAQRRGVSFKCP